MIVASCFVTELICMVGGLALGAFLAYVFLVVRDE